MPNQKRQLVAIMFTDIVGYTALMGKDSKKALNLVRQSKFIQKPLVEKHNGLWLKEMGDGAMAQFSSALDAVNCVIEIQELARAKFDAKIRIGIHLGDITIEDNDVYGDGVNVAARLESVADPGGIYISESIEKAIRGQSDIQTKFLGEIQLKNVDYAVPTYALQGEGLPLPKVELERKISGGFFTHLTQRAKSPAGIVIILLSIVVLTVSGNTLYNAFWNTSVVSTVNIDKSIAVMPFDNQSKLEEDASFTDGVHNDLLTQISKIRDIKSISRSSVMEYRNTSKNLFDISEELGVATIMEGSVQRAGSKIRINVQLIDAGSGSTLWAETFTRELNVENILAIQSEIAKAVAAALKIVLSPAEKKDFDNLPAKSLAALEAYFDAKLSYDKHVKEGYEEAINKLTIAVELDPTFAEAYAWLGAITLNKFWWAGADIEEQIAKGKPLIEKAMQLDSTNSEVQMFYGWLKGYEKGAKERILTKMKAEGNKHDIAEVEAAIDKLHYASKHAYQKAIELNPNNARAYALYAGLLAAENKDDEELAFLLKARELDPLDDGLAILTASRFLRRRRYDEAQQIAEEIIIRKPNYSDAYGILAGVAFAGRHRAAEGLRLYYKAETLNPDLFRKIIFAFIYDHLGFRQQANEWFSSAFPLYQEPSPIAGLAKGYINEFKGEYDNAFEAYLLAPEGDDPVMELTMSNLTNLALKINRSIEFIEHFYKVYPELFEADVIIDKSNYVQAFSLGRILKAKGDDDAQGEHLLKGSLKVVQRDNIAVVGEEFNNYECRIYLALGNYEAALASFIKLVEKGIYSDRIIRDPVYKPLYRFPEFQKNMDKMRARLAEEQAKVEEMLAEGALDIPTLQ